MELITLQNFVVIQIRSNQELLDLIDKRYNNIFIQKFNPHQVIEWWKTSLKIRDGVELENVLVRDMEFDLQTDLIGLKKLIELYSGEFGMYLGQWILYQFEKPVPDTLTLEHLPKDSKEQILETNGLKHVFWIRFEMITVSSFDPEFISSIEENPKFKERIETRKKEL